MPAIRTTEAEILTELMLSVFRINGRLLSGGDHLVAPLDLTSARWQVLGAIALAGHALSVPEIADRMGITRQGAQKQLNKLVEDGFVASHANPRHKRSPLFDLTDRGAGAYRRVDEIYSQWANDLSAGMAKSALNAALAVLKNFEHRLANDPHVKGDEP